MYLPFSLLPPPIRCHAADVAKNAVACHDAAAVCCRRHIRCFVDAIVAAAYARFIIMMAIITLILIID